MFSGVTAPFNRYITFCQNVGVLHLAGGLGLHHQNLRRRLCYEVRLIFLIINSGTVEELELPPGWLKPLQCFALKNYGELSLGVRLKLLSWVQAARESSE